MMNDNFIFEIQTLISSGDTGRAMMMLDEAIALNDSAELRLTRGKLLWRLGRHTAAISDYEHALALDPESPAALLLQQSREIMDFYHRDLYNP